MDRPKIIKKLATDVAERRLSFPTNVAVALKIRETLDDPDCHIETAAKLVLAEPMLAARVVAIANSATYNRSGREVSDVRSAVSKLGFTVVRNLAIALVTRQMAGASKNKQELKLAADLWEYTANVASLARLIARDVTHIDPDTAMFTAIVHDIGGFYLLSRAADFPGLLDEGLTDDDTEAELELCHAILGIIGVPPSVQAAVDEFWAGYLELPPVSLGDTLLLAANLSPKPRPLDYKTNASESNFRASINLALGKETLESILEESADEVKSLVDALKF